MYIYHGRMVRFIGTVEMMEQDMNSLPTDIQFRASLGDDSSTSNLHITLEDKSYFLGSYAELQSNIREFTDTLYFMVAIGIGLAAGTGALGIALMMSMVFCYSLLIVFRLTRFLGSTRKPASSI